MKILWKKVEKQGPFRVNPRDTVTLYYDGKKLQQESITEEMVIDQTCVFQFEDFEEFSGGIGGIFGRAKEEQ